MSILTRIIDRIKREPAVVIGIAGVAILAALQSLAGNGVIPDDLPATWANLVGSVEEPGPIALLLAGIVTRFFVSPAAKIGV